VIVDRHLGGYRGDCPESGVNAHHLAEAVSAVDLVSMRVYKGVGIFPNKPPDKTESPYPF